MYLLIEIKNSKHNIHLLFVIIYF